MRVFLAIDLPDSIKKDIEIQITPFKKEYPQMTWVPQNNFQITTFSFGELNQIDNVKKIIEEAVYDIPSFAMFSLSADLFITNRITLYLGFQRVKNIEHVVERITESYKSSQSKQKFVPHLTLARYRVPSKQQYLLIKKKIQNLSINIEFTVSKLYLYDSNLNQLAEFSLLDE